MSGQKITSTFSVNKHLVKDNLSLLNGYLTRGAEISSQKQFATYTGGPVYMPYQGTVVISFENDLNFINKLFINNPFLQSSTGVEVLAVDPNGGTATTNSLQSAVKANNGQIEIFGLGDIKAGGTLTIRAGVGNSIIPQDIITTLVSQNQEPGGEFGIRVAIDGDTVVIGARNEDAGAINDGRAYIYTLSGGVWTLQRTLESTNPVDDGNFGWSVAIDGDTVVVGARNEDGGAIFSGRVYIYTRSGGVWTLQDELVSDDPDAFGRFGNSVGVYGDTLIVGAVDENAGFTNSGRVYIFIRSGGNWTLQDTLVSPNSELSGSFGNSVGIYQDTVIIGAEGENVGGDTIGRAYIFTRSGGTWTLEDTLDSQNPEDFGVFGSSVTVYQDTAIVGAIGEENIESKDGRAYIFTRSGGVWSWQQTLVSPNPDTNGFFGASVSIDGDTLVIGASGEDAGANGSGRSYIFTHGNGAWSLQETLVSPNPGTNGFFGASVAVNDTTTIIGAHRENGLRGRAYIFAL